MFGSLEDPRTAFETMVSRGILPASVMADASSRRRRFTCAVCDSVSTSDGEFVKRRLKEFCDSTGGCDSSGHRSFPCSADDAETWATSQWKAAESLAEELVSRLAPWGVPRCSGFLWHLEPEKYDLYTRQAEWIPPSLLDGFKDASGGLTNYLWRQDDEWASASRIANLVSRSDAEAWAITMRLVWRSENACPFLPMAEILRLGCAFNRITEEGTIVLVMPR